MTDSVLNGCINYCENCFSKTSYQNLSFCSCEASHIWASCIEQQGSMFIADVCIIERVRPRLFMNQTIAF